MTDRRRINGPAGATIPAVYEDEGSLDLKTAKGRSRPPNAIRKMCTCHHPPCQRRT
jgi:exosome complex component MTR3